MPVTVISFCGYMCNRSLVWRKDEDYHSYKWVQALKRKPVNGYAHVSVRGARKYLAEGNKDDAAAWFGMFVADYLRKNRVDGPFLVVPVPNSDSILPSNRPRTRRMARTVCGELNDGSTMLDCLRFKRDLGSARDEGGPRDAETLYKNLAVLKDSLKDVDTELDVLLVDDVTTSGGHLQACAAKLEAHGLTVKLVFCGGKTVYDQTKKAFHIYTDVLSDYQP